MRGCCLEGCAQPYDAVEQLAAAFHMQTASASLHLSPRSASRREHERFGGHGLRRPRLSAASSLLILCPAVHGRLYAAAILPLPAIVIAYSLTPSGLLRLRLNRVLRHCCCCQNDWYDT